MNASIRPETSELVRLCAAVPGLQPERMAQALTIELSEQWDRLPATSLAIMASAAALLLQLADAPEVPHG